MKTRLLRKLRRQFGRRYSIDVRVEKGILRFVVVYGYRDYKTECFGARNFVEAFEYINRSISKDILSHISFMKDSQKKKYDISCRYGVNYKIEIKGNPATIRRTIDMLSKCCCFVCFNHGCKHPKDEKIKGCNNICELFTESPYCESSK